MASPPPSMASRVGSLILRLLALAALVGAAAILTTNTDYLEVMSSHVKVRFKDIYSYRYMLGTIIIGAAYTLYQAAVALHRASLGNRLTTCSDGALLFDFFGDKLISYLLATGAAAGFGATRDMKAVFDGVGINTFFNRGYASSALLLIAFVCTALLSIGSSFALPKRT